MESSKKQKDQVKNSSPVCYADDEEVRPEYKIEWPKQKSSKQKKE